jgi:hypothetical protein
VREKYRSDIWFADVDLKQKAVAYQKRHERLIGCCATGCGWSPSGSDGMDRARVDCLKTARNLLGCFRLFIDVVVAAFVIPFEVFRTQLGTKIVIEALVIHIELSSDVLRITRMEVSHIS